MSLRFLCHYKVTHVVCEAEGQISYMYQANSAIALVEFLLKITSNNSFQLFLSVLLNFAL